MYFHGLNEFGSQKTRVATSQDGLAFKTREKIVGWPYFRKFKYQNNDYALSMPGIIYKNTGDIEDFMIINQVMEENKDEFCQAFLKLLTQICHLCVPQKVFSDGAVKFKKDKAGISGLKRKQKREIIPGTKCILASHLTMIWTALLTTSSVSSKL